MANCFGIDPLDHSSKWSLLLTWPGYDLKNRHHVQMFDGNDDDDDNDDDNDDDCDDNDDDDV